MTVCYLSKRRQQREAVPGTTLSLSQEQNYIPIAGAAFSNTDSGGKLSAMCAKSVDISIVNCLSSSLTNVRCHVDAKVAINSSLGQLVNLLKWLNGKHLLPAIIQPVKIDSEAWIHLPSRNWYQFADPERIAGLVSPEYVVTSWLQLFMLVTRLLFDPLLVCFYKFHTKHE